jgi:hypothetical protein
MAAAVPPGATKPPELTVTAPTVPDPARVAPVLTATFDVMEPLTASVPAVTVVAPV